MEWSALAAILQGTVLAFEASTCKALERHQEKQRNLKSVTVKFDDSVPMHLKCLSVREREFWGLLVNLVLVKLLVNLLENAAFYMQKAALS